jgi:hypothetical protein
VSGQTEYRPDQPLRSLAPQEVVARYDWLATHWATHSNGALMKLVDEVVNVAREQDRTMRSSG